MLKWRVAPLHFFGESLDVERNFAREYACKRSEKSEN